MFRWSLVLSIFCFRLVRLAGAQITELPMSPETNPGSETTISLSSEVPLPDMDPLSATTALMDQAPELGGSTSSITPGAVPTTTDAETTAPVGVTGTIQSGDNVTTLPSTTMGATMTANASESSEWNSSDLETVLSAIKALSKLQNETLEQQKAYQDDRQAVKKVLDEKETAILKTLQEQEKIIRSIQNKVNRKLSKARRTADGLAQEGSRQPKDCADISADGAEGSGVYRVWPTWDSSLSFFVYCDMETDDGGWTVIQRRGNFGLADDYFHKSWEDYKRGFGDLYTEFWLGNEQIWLLTNQGGYQVRFDLMEEDSTKFALYQSFWIESESQGYRLHVGRYDPRGNASDIFVRNNEQEFSTKDRSRSYGQVGCASSTQRQGWWYSNQCDVTPIWDRPTVQTERTTTEKVRFDKRLWTSPSPRPTTERGVHNHQRTFWTNGSPTERNHNSPVRFWTSASPRQVTGYFWSSVSPRQFADSDSRFWSGTVHGPGTEQSRYPENRFWSGANGEGDGDEDVWFTAALQRPSALPLTELKIRPVHFPSIKEEDA